VAPSANEAIQVRIGRPADARTVARQFVALWREGTLPEHEGEAAAILLGKAPSTLPVVLFVAEVERQVVGFVEVGLRSHADGCDPGRPVGFVEGWYVEPEQRGRGVGRALMGAAEDWARSQGCHELASDTWIDNEPSQRAHEALAFEVVDRCVNYRKSLR
jgi:aminoglycoside 6'-N-acetyltransferase I